MWYSENWIDYELIDAEGGERLERWGDYILIRPDPQIIWTGERKDPRWRKADGVYRRSKSGGGKWVVCNIPEEWCINYRDLTFKLRPMGFKHTGLFPEQAANWDFIRETIKNSGREIKVLNLFAYTGGATVAAAAAGAKVCHVDASKGMVNWAKENATLSGLIEHPIRYIVDDVKKFVQREIRRGHKYDGIIMDPPSYGRGPGGEVFKIENEIFDLVELCVQLLPENPLFFLINSYTTGLSGSVMKNIAGLTIGKRFGGVITSDEVGLPIENSDLVLPCGYSTRWQRR